MTGPETERRPSPLATVGTLLLLAAILVAAVYGFAHASLQPVNPEQKAPTKHFGGVQCAVCHTVTSKAKLVEVQ